MCGLGIQRSVADGQVLGDRRRSPNLHRGRPVATRYADNGNFICWDAQDGVAITRAMRQYFDECGLDYRIEPQSV